MMHIYSWFVRKALLGLVAVSVLTLCSCKSAEVSSEPVYTDMYQIKSYQIEVVTNEITTTYFVTALALTNRFYVPSNVTIDPLPPVDYDYGVHDTSSGEIEFQCVGDSCKVK